MSMLNLKKQFYSIKELKEIIGVTQKKDILKNLDKYGYDFLWINRKGAEITKTPDENSPEEQLKSLLMQRLGLNVQTDFKAFAAMFYLFIEDEGFQTMPWEARANQIKKEFGIEISDRSLRTYMSKLIKENIAIKDDGFREYWRTTYKCGIEKVQEPVTFDEEEEMQEWVDKRTAYLEEADKLYQEAMQEPEAKNPKRWQIAIRKLWDETKTIYYPVKGFVFNAFEDKEIRELHRLSALVIANIELEEDIEEVEEKPFSFSTSCVGADGGFVF